MAIKFAKTIRSPKRIAYDKKLHHDNRLERRNLVIQKMGGKCVVCKCTDTLWFYYIGKRKRKRALKSLTALLKTSSTLKKALRLSKGYQLMCKPHHQEKWRASLPKRQHGKASTYAGSGRIPCRCVPCTAAWNEYTKKWHKEKNRKRREARELLKSASIKKLFA